MTSDSWGHAVAELSIQQFQLTTPHPTVTHERTQHNRPTTPSVPVAPPPKRDPPINKPKHTNIHPLHISPGHRERSTSLLDTGRDPHLSWTQGEIHISPGHRERSTSLLDTGRDPHLSWTQGEIHISPGHRERSTSLLDTGRDPHLSWTQGEIHISPGPSRERCAQARLLQTSILSPTLTWRENNSQSCLTGKGTFVDAI
uniref:Uncharacterized protein n=1 Tax=Branchiostoma floridae TaxID=7739 RepID=C3YMJ3_BRAFL|eukprot:XP_002602477.1 hypothetical protein BRAFLDRAFT_86861 [Branchiostoma floridae]